MSQSVTEPQTALLQEGTRFLSFSLGSENYAIPLLAVKEVIALADITAIPFTPPYFVGIMNLRGQVISVIDLRKKFNIKYKESGETAVIICDLFPLCLGIVVDSVDAVLAPLASEMSPRPEVDSQVKTDYITQVYRKDDHLVLLLDLAKTLSVEDHLSMAKSGSSSKAAA
jgi:purine-binding chemotaxis protein CheW